MAADERHDEHGPEGAATLSEEEKAERRRVADAWMGTPEDEQARQMVAHTIDVGALAGVVEQQAAADAADTLEALHDEEASDVLQRMEDQAAAEALAEMQAPLAASVIEDLLAEEKTEYAGHLIELMAPDDAVDLLQALEPEQRDQVLASMDVEAAEELVPLSAYDPETAGGIMTTDFLALRESMSIQEAIEYIRSTDVPEHTQVALVTDDEDRLIGLLGLRELLLARRAQRVGDVMDPEVEAIRPDLDREAVAHTFDRYDYSLLPVVDDNDRLLGMITVDDVIDIIREEQTEDVQRSVGAGKGEAIYSPVREKLRGRTPWLGASLGLMCVSAAVVLFGEELIERRPVLAFLLPVIAAVVGNGGQQTMMVTLRGIVLEEVREGRVGPLVLKEILVGAINGAVLGLLMFLGIGLLSNVVESATWDVGAIAGVSMTVAMTTATLAGSCVPLIMKKLGIDPALASSILLIMITDGVSFCTLLALVAYLL